MRQRFEVVRRGLLIATIFLGAVTVWAIGLVLRGAMTPVEPTGDAPPDEQPLVVPLAPPDTLLIPPDPDAPLISAEELALAHPHTFRPPAQMYRPEKAGFSVRYGDLLIPYRIFGLYVQPGERIELQVERSGGTFALVTQDGQVMSTETRRWVWQAPAAPGVYRLTIHEAGTGEEINLNVFVRRPFDPRTAVLNGYRIGQYGLTTYRGNPVYTPPRGLIEATPEVLRAYVSPHFTLGQFLGKQASAFPKYLLLDERLLLKLELLLERINAAGHPVPTLHVMSGYRTPFYNRSIGNTTTYSAHLYGISADVFVDANNDGTIDDLDGDGQITIRDAQYMTRLAEELDALPSHPYLVGGLGIYPPAPHRGPFIHVDVRGERVRW